MKASTNGLPAPTVVVLNGMDNAKEMSIFFAGREFARRGINTLALDGPGMGETRRIRDMPSRYDYEVPGTAAFDFLAKRSDVDAKRIVIFGYSFGGYYSSRVAAFEKRYAAWRLTGTSAQRVADPFLRRRFIDRPVSDGGRWRHSRVVLGFRAGISALRRNDPTPQ